MTLDIDVQPRQQMFIDAAEDEVLFGGAAGGGKSYGQETDALLDSIRYPGYRTLILRRTFPDLERSLIDLHREIFPGKPFYSYNETRHRGTFCNGSIIDFGYLDTESDKYQYQGAEYDRIRFDELTQFTETQYLYLLSRCRGKTPYPRSLKSSTNPGGIGHSWVKKRFIDPAQPGKAFSAVEKAETPFGTITRKMTRVFIPSSLKDNKKLMDADPNYMARLMFLPKNERDALLFGRWDLFEGRFFSEWDERAMVYEPHVLPAEWPRYFAMDYGTDMLAGLWAAVDVEGDLWIYREVYEGRDNEMGAGGRGHIISAAAKRIKELTQADERILQWMGPGDLGSISRDTGRTQAEVFGENGIHLTLYRQDRRSGWLDVREYLAPAVHADGKKRPRLHIAANCRNLIRCMPELQYSQKDTMDCATEPHEITHAPDALRVLCSGYMTTAEPDRKRKTGLEDFYTKPRRTVDQILGEGEKETII